MVKTNIYVLRLSRSKFYVGKSEDPHKRFEEHLRGYGSAWTRKYKPLKIEKIIKNASPFDEDKFTKEYMVKYGIENVRGGSYIEEELDDTQIEMLEREMRMAEDRCTRCGREGHFAKSCYAKTELINAKQPTCYRCGREGHYSPECYASKHIKGYYLD
jgi:predicted GIY-YIG superfamily endonuclease